MFQEFSPRAGICCREANCLIIEQNRAGLHSTVSPPDGVERGPIEKFAPPPRPWGLTPILTFCFTGTLIPYKPWKFREKIATHFWEKIFSKNLRKFTFFGVRGNSQYQRIQKNSSIVPPYRWTKFGRAAILSTYLFCKKPFSPLPPMEEAPNHVSIKCRKKSNNGVGWCWFQYSSTNKPQGGYIFYAGGNIAGVSCCRRWPRLLLLSWQR